MKSILRVAIGLLGSLILLNVVALIGARFADGPVAILAGGPFTSGELVTGPEPDWSFVHDIQEVEFQLIDPPRSRTTWILELEGRIYIPCGYMTTRWGKIWKQWPIEALKDGRAILRIDDKLYKRELARIEKGPLLAPLTAELDWKCVRHRPAEGPHEQLFDLNAGPSRAS